MSGLPRAAPRQARWDARLELRFAARASGTYIARRRHAGPFCIQKPFYPGDGACHVYLLHPPGGLAGGDRLVLETEVGAGAATLMTTPASTKFYRSLGQAAEQTQRLRVGPEASLEWLPQDTILFGGCRAVTHTKIDLAGDARFVGWEVASLGRPLSGDAFVHGSLAQSVEINVDGDPLLLERLAFEAADPLLDARYGLAGHGAWGSMYVYPGDDGLLDCLREAVAPEAGRYAAATRIDGLLVLRMLAGTAAAVLGAFRRVWSVLRAAVIGMPATEPRIWNT